MRSGGSGGQGSVGVDHKGRLLTDSMLLKSTNQLPYYGNPCHGKSMVRDQERSSGEDRASSWIGTTSERSNDGAYVLPASLGTPRLPRQRPCNACITKHAS